MLFLGALTDWFLPVLGELGAGKESERLTSPGFAAVGNRILECSRARDSEKPGAKVSALEEDRVSRSYQQGRPLPLGAVGFLGKSGTGTGPLHWQGRRVVARLPGGGQNGGPRRTGPAGGAARSAPPSAGDAPYREDDRDRPPRLAFVSQLECARTQPRTPDDPGPAGPDHAGPCADANRLLPDSGEYLPPVGTACWSPRRRVRRTGAARAAGSARRVPEGPGSQSPWGVAARRHVVGNRRSHRDNAIDFGCSTNPRASPRDTEGDSDSHRLLKGPTTCHCRMPSLFGR